MRMPLLDRAFYLLDGACSPQDFTLILHLNDAPAVDRFYAGAKSAMNRFPTSACCVDGQAWVWRENKYFKIEVATSAAEIERFIDEPFDLRRERPVKQILILDGGVRLATRFHHSAADGLSAALWLGHQLNVAFGLESAQSEPREFNGLALRRLPASVRRSQFAFDGASDCLWTRNLRRSGARRWLTIGFPATDLQKLCRRAGGFTYNDLLATCALEVLRRWNANHGRPQSAAPTNSSRKIKISKGDDSRKIKISEGDDSRNVKISEGDDSRDIKISEGDDSRNMKISEGDGSPEIKISKGDDSRNIKISKGDDSRDIKISEGDDSRDIKISEGDDSRNIKISEGDDSRNIKISEGDDSRNIKISEGDDSRNIKISEGDDSRNIKISEGDDSRDIKISERDDSRNIKISEGDDSRDIKISEGDDSRDIKISESDDSRNIKISEGDCRGGTPWPPAVVSQSKIGLWIPMNVRCRAAEGFGNGTSRIRVYARYDPEAKFIDKCREVRRQVAWSSEHGEWVVPELPWLTRLPRPIIAPLLRGYLNRASVDMATGVFSHAGTGMANACEAFKHVERVESVGLLHPRQNLAINAATHYGHTWLTLTYDPALLTTDDAKELSRLYEEQIALAYESLS